MTPAAAPAYQFTGAGAIRTPALVIDLDRVDANIHAVATRCARAGVRWRPHVKTAKARDVMARFATHGIAEFKCATPKELGVLLDLGAPDVLLSFPVVGATARHVRELAARHPGTRVSVLVETAGHLRAFTGSGLGAFVDVNPGMDRTGRDRNDAAAITALAQCIADEGCVFRGIHWYDGHLHGLDATERERAAHAGYDALVRLAAGVGAREIVVAGTPAAPCALSYPRWGEARAQVHISPGTVVYNDTTSLAQLPAEWGLQPAAFVLSTVVSHPRAGRFTCDAGHKSVSADAGVPTCEVVGHAEWTPAKPSEEHLPVDVAAPAAVPPIGSTLLLVPRHVCPTVNNFDEAVAVRNGAASGTIAITARGH